MLDRRLHREPIPSWRLLRPSPGHPDWASLFGEARDLADALRPRLARPAFGLREARRRANAYRTALGNYGVNRRLARQGREDLRPLYFIWTMLRRCNFRCEYCDDHRSRRYPDLPEHGTLDTERGSRLLSIMRTGTSSVYFAGGEPTLRRDLPELTRAARELDYYPILINTNGSGVDRLLALPRYRTWLADLDVVIVSLDGLDTRALTTMWGYGRPRDVLKNLLLLRELAAEMRIKLMVNCVIQPGKVGHARDVLDFCNDLGIWFCPVPMNRGPRIAPGLGEDPGYRALCDLILARKGAGYRVTGSLRLNRRLLGAAPLACRNTLKPHVDHDGFLYWPCKASVNVEPARIDVLAFDDLASLWSHARRSIEPTRFHGPARNQCGADCNWAQNYTTDAYVHGLRQPLSLLRDVGELLSS